MPDDLEHEASRATELLEGKAVQRVWRHSPSEVGIEFSDGTRLFVDGLGATVELSITAGQPKEG